MRPVALASARGQTRVLEIRDEHGKVHLPPFSCEVLLPINWGQKAFRIESDGTVEFQSNRSPLEGGNPPATLHLQPPTTQ